MKRYLIRIKGEVHGVGFRANAAEQAKEFGLKGFVRNEKDGSVFLDVEGDDMGLHQMLAWCADGPRFARVSHVTYKVADELRHYTNFAIL